MPEAAIQPHRWGCVSQKETNNLPPDIVTPLEPWLGNKAGVMQFTAWETELGVAFQELEPEQNRSGNKVQVDWG